MKPVASAVSSISILFLVCSLCSQGIAHRAEGANPYKLKLAARGALCFTCHETIEEQAKNLHVHPLLKKGECTGCHDVHASSHEGLLITDVTQLCRNCHQDIIPEIAQSAHSAVTEGNCITCHDPHGTKGKNLLTQAGNDLCYECHTELEEEIKTNEFQHKAMSKQGCLTCHYPHASDTWSFLLRSDGRTLCLKCHKTTGQYFQRQHMNYPVANTDCTSCHNPHGSDKRGLLFVNAHDPVSKNQCTACHRAPESANALQTKKQGIELCAECHQDTINDAFNKNRVHGALLDPTGCTNCHTPHASRGKHLLKKSMDQVCGACHADTVHLQQVAMSHPDHEYWCEPVKNGNCTVCHVPHASNAVLRLTKVADNVGLCGECHEWQAHSSHPLGEKIIDPRNPNVSIDCLSCHKGCGTANNTVMLHYPSVYELCVRCHVDRRR